MKEKKREPQLPKIVVIDPKDIDAPMFGESFATALAESKHLCQSALDIDEYEEGDELYVYQLIEVHRLKKTARWE